MTYAELKEKLLRDHCERMHEIDKKAIDSTVKLAQAHEQLILKGGLVGIAQERLDKIFKQASDSIETIKETTGPEVPDVQT